MPHQPRHEPGVYRSENGTSPTPAPADSCVVDTDAIDRLDGRMKALEKQGEEMLRAIVGHPAIGHTGLVGRQDRLEIQMGTLKEQHEKNDRKLFRFGTILTLAGAVALFLKDVLVNWITSTPHKP